MSIAHSTDLPLRHPDTVMDLERLGAFHQTRISFVRSLLRKMTAEQWQIGRPIFDLDANGYGTCIYTIETPYSETYSVVLFSQHLDDAARTDRVIAEAWDMAAVLCEGVPNEARLDQLRENVPKQEAGRNEPDVLVLSRANKSTRNFAYFIDCLARGEQPNPQVLTKVGYLVRTTAVYGNGKFGVADFAKLQTRRAFSNSFSAQMLTVYLIRQFSIDLVEHIARQQAPDAAVPLQDDIKRYLGVGNATGLGMAPFLVNHPKLIHRWILMRETALARVLYASPITADHLGDLACLLEKAQIHFSQTFTTDARQQAKYGQVCAEIPHIMRYLEEESAVSPQAWQKLMDWAAHSYAVETQELLVSLLLELYPEQVNELEDGMNAAEHYELQPEMTLAELKTLLENEYDWALKIDFSQPKAQHLFWYRSAEKEEPRLGERDHEPGADKEMHIAIGRSVQTLYQQIDAADAAELEQPVVYFLLKHPSYKGIVRRIQSLQFEPYGEIRSNLIDQDCLPIYLLRCKLSCFGASKFDPKSSRWVRITLFQGAPIVADLKRPFKDDWCFPIAPQS